ncbi:MAG: hypothetical protein WCD70_13050 [Alphaproteobacteria bacterium]
MSTDLSSKIQNALWWITSIATSVVCCSVIFVLFASYFVDVRQDIKEGNIRINAIEEREDKILSEIEIIRKHTMPLPGQAVETPGVPAAAPVAPMPVAAPAPTPPDAAMPVVTPPAPAPTPDAAQPAAPAAVAPITPPAIVPAPTKQ